MEKFFIREMVKEGIISYKIGEVPVGCLIVKDNKIIYKSHNLKYSKNSPIYHAEINSIIGANKILNSMYLNECSMYVTLEPCIMCAGAIFEARIKNLFIGASNPYKGFFSNNYHKTYENINIYWLNDFKCEYLLNSFFKKKKKRAMKFHSSNQEF